MAEIAGIVYPLHVGSRDDPEGEVFDHEEPAQVVTARPRKRHRGTRWVMGRLVRMR